MRWYEWTALILTAALTLGAYVFGTEWAANRMFSSEIDRAYHDTYFVIAHQAFMRQVVLVLMGGIAVFALILWMGGPVLRRIASLTIVCWGIAICFAVLPQHFIARSGMPRRLIDEPQSLSVWNDVAQIASLLAASCTVILFILLVIALIQRRRRSRSDTPTT